MFYEHLHFTALRWFDQWIYCGWFAGYKININSSSCTQLKLVWVCLLFWIRYRKERALYNKNNNIIYCKKRVVPLFLLNMVWRPVNFSLWKSRQRITLFWLLRDRVQMDKKQAVTRQSAPCGKSKCHTRKNLCIAYTQVNTHAHFFFYIEDISRALASPPTWRRLKFISLTPDKPAPALSGTGSEVIKDSWRNRSYSRLSKKQKKPRGTNSNLSNGTTHTHAHKHTHPESTLTNSLTSCG